MRPRLRYTRSLCSAHLRPDTRDFGGGSVSEVCEHGGLTPRPPALTPRWYNLGMSDEPSRMQFVHYLVILVLAGAFLASCRRANEHHRPLPLWPVEGQVFIDGKPAEGAVIRLHVVPVTSGQTAFPSGVVDVHGQFRISMYKTGDGAPAATYWISLELPAGEIDQHNQLRTRYADPRGNAERDPSHFVVEVRAPEDDSKPKPTVIPRIDLTIEGIEPGTIWE